jgi:YbbR domain-containing protein
LLALDDYVEKRVPVVPRMVVSFHQGYGQVGPVRVTPESVIVGGAKLILERLTAWHTEYEKFSSLQSSVDVTLALEEPETFSFNVPPQPVRVRINVQPYAEKVFPGIPVTATATPPYREVIFIPPRMDLVVRGGIEQLTKLSSNDFSASVNYENLAQDSSEEVAPVLGCPPEVIVIGRKPERFQYIIRRKLQ